MLSYAIRRLLIAIPTLLIVITVAFFMMRIAPGGPFDKPLPEQYVIYLGKILRGDFGPSIKIRDFTVAELIMAGAPASMQLGLSAIILALVFGVGFGTYAALRQNSAVDFIVMGIAMIGIAVPNFVMAPLLSLVFGLYLSLLPTAGWGDGELKYKILPIIALALPQIAYIARLTRGSMVEVLHSNYPHRTRQGPA